MFFRTRFVRFSFEGKRWGTLTSIKYQPYHATTTTTLPSTPPHKQETPRGIRLKNTKSCGTVNLCSRICSFSRKKRLTMHARLVQPSCHATIVHLDTAREPCFAAKTSSLSARSAPMGEHRAYIVRTYARVAPRRQNNSPTPGPTTYDNAPTNPNMPQQQSSPQ